MLTMGGTVDAEVWRRTPADASMELRVDILEDNVEHLRDRIRDLRDEMRRKLEAQAAAHEAEIQQLVEADKDIEARRESASVGGSHIESVGLAWLAVGAVFAGIPAPMAALFEAISSGLGLNPICVV